ncbi:MAG: class I SAM-dependent methyltransferase [Sedimentisphaerales bacterium]|nr:class I SAM-dependent methyltransferase [Sedimentisphaerales bacterium]
MRYTLKNIEIRTENTAKPRTQASKVVIEWIKAQPNAKSVLDLGCGKLRYTAYLAEKCEHLGLVDSKLQIGRRQMLGKSYSTVSDYAPKIWPNSEVYSIEEFWEKPRRRYDLVLCANVISAIPSREARVKTLESILRCLTKRGRVLFVNQCANSYFTKMANSKKARSYLDGYILHTSRGNYYYGILPEAKMRRILWRCGFKVINSWRRGQSAFVLGGVP